MKQKFKIKFFYRPGKKLPDREKIKLSKELKEIAGTCFENLPDYQCLQEDSDALNDKIITIAYDCNHQPIGFSSAVLFNIKDVGEVLHLGLMCIKPSMRQYGLSHKLSSKLVIHYLLKRHTFQKIWITNIACVLSSLGNVALHFDNVYPSPFNTQSPFREHFLIAKAVDKIFRRNVYINHDAQLDPWSFVFKGSVKGTVFQKRAQDKQYYHRISSINTYYKELMDFTQGDEILQIGTVSLLTPLRYSFKQRKIRRLKSLNQNNLVPATM